MLTEHLPPQAIVPRPSEKVSVLLVDDDEQYAAFVRSVFEESEVLDFELQHVKRLSEALPRLEEQPFSVVLLDVNLPDGDGLRWLLANQSQLRTAVIVLTADPDCRVPADVASAAQDFLVKFQVQPEHLVRAVQYAADREQVRQQLVQSREYFQSLIEQARDLITVVDESSAIVYQSPACVAMLGRSPEDMLGRRLGELASGDDGPRLRTMLVSLFDRSVETAAGEFEFRHRDGSVRILDMVASRIPSSEGRRAVVNSRDVTERRRAEETLRGQDEQLRQAMKMEAIGRLAGGIAHDFSNVLTVITAACERLQLDTGPGGTPRAEFATILNNCRRAASLTHQLLAFSRKQTLSPQPINLGHLLGNADRLLRPLIGEHIDLRISVDPQLYAVEADPVQMEQVLLNLAINARDAMPTGGVLGLKVSNVLVSEAFAKSHPPMVSGPYVLLEVQDTGCGMSPGTKARAFEPFFTTKGLEGTGLGLSTVYGIVKQSGGYIWISSEAGEGTTFSIHMPPTSAEPVVSEPAQAVEKAPTLHATILLTEDDDDVRQMLGLLLESAGHTVITAEDPERALEVALGFNGRIDLLLTDVVMPRGTGRDLARRMAFVRPETRVLYMSGYPEYGTNSGSVLEPGVPFLAKPFTRDVLIQKINDLLA